MWVGTDCLQNKIKIGRILDGKSTETFKIYFYIQNQVLYLKSGEIFKTLDATSNHANPKAWQIGIQIIGQDLEHLPVMILMVSKLNNDATKHKYSTFPE